MSVFHALAAILAVQAQPSDPLAPLPPTTSQDEPSDATPAEQPRPAPPVAVVVAPKDWRGVFDAIGASQWQAAQLGIATLPAGPLTPVAKAELYTAKGSPKVSLDALLDLLIEHGVGVRTKTVELLELADEGAADV